MSNFSHFHLDPKILKLLQEIGYSQPTPIQEQAIPKILEGCDVIACAQTGTGKTAAFMLPTLHLLSQPDFRAPDGPQVLVLVPTRELAMQVAEEAKKFSKYLSKTKTVCIYGGVPYPQQRRMLASRYEILVATPGRLIDHLEQGRINLGNIQLLVMDEADRMLDMGFIDAVEEIASHLPAQRQTLLFSATIDKRILPVSAKMQNNPCQIKVEATPLTESNIEQRLYYVDNIGHKMRILEHILENTEINQSIVFTSTIQQANELADYLRDRDYLSAALHGDMNQRQRTRTIDKLRRGQYQFLVATDVAARGIDIAALTHIINFDLPFVPEDFIHRIGRTGRAGAKGTAITFATYKEEPKLVKINNLIGKPIEQFTVAGMEPRPMEKQKSGMHKGRPSRFNRGGSGTSRHNKSNDRTSFSKRYGR